MAFRRKLVFFLSGLSNFSWKNSRAGWLAGWNAVFTQLSEVNRLAVWLAGWLLGWLPGWRSSAMCLYGYSMLKVFSRGFTTQMGGFPKRSL